MKRQQSGDGRVVFDEDDAGKVAAHMTLYCK